MGGFGRHNPVERKLVGHVSVDSGQVILTDPCYVDEGFSYHELLRGWGARFGGDVEREHAIPGPLDLGVVVETAWGDGVYPVFIEVQEGRVMRVTVEFDEYEDEGEDA